MDDIEMMDVEVTGDTGTLSINPKAVTTGKFKIPKIQSKISRLSETSSSGGEIQALVPTKVKETLEARRRKRPAVELSTPERLVTRVATKRKTMPPSILLPGKQIQGRKVITARRRIPVSVNKSIAQTQTKKVELDTFYVLDTNILLNYFVSFKKMINQIPKDRISLAKFKIIIAGVVLTELDHMKMEKRIAREIIRTINEQFSDPSQSLISGDHLYTLTRDARSGKEKAVDLPNFEVFNNDDRLLRSCLMIREAQSSSSSPPTVFIITKDINLINKCLNHQIPNIDFSELESRVHKLHTTGLDEGLPDDKKVKRAMTDKLEPKPPKLLKLPSPKRIIEPQPSPAKGLKKIPSSDHRKQWDALKKSFEPFLKDFMMTVLKKTYGDMWDKIFKIDFSKFTMKAGLGIMRSGWLGCFSDVFGRNKDVQNIATKIFSLLNNESSNASELVTLVKDLQTFITEAITKHSLHQAVRSLPESSSKMDETINDVFEDAEMSFSSVDNLLYQ